MRPMQDPWPNGYIATVTLPDGRGGGILDIRCLTPEVARSREFRDLAEGICEVVARRSPRYLERSALPPDEASQVLRECRLDGLRRGLPDDELEGWAAAAAEEILARRCLLELPLGERTVGEAVEDLARRVGHLLEIRRFYRMSLDD